MVETPEQEKQNGTRYIVTCPCGLARCLPQGIRVGDSFELVACNKCGQTMIGTFIGDRVEVK